MELVEWTDEISVGVARIDEEHRTLLTMLNDLREAVEAGQDQAAAFQAVERMRAYALLHFKTEEEAMTASGYPSRTGHVAEHDSFIERVLDLEAALDEAGGVRAADIWHFLRSWLADHILRHDKLMGEHLRASGMQ